MRRFHSYGPVDCEDHFCVPRRELVRKCLDQLIGRPEKRGQYFTVWAPRQAGKTWLMQQVKKRIEQEHQGRFVVGGMSMQGVFMQDDDPPDVFLSKVPLLMKEAFQRKDISAPRDWEGLKQMFSKDEGIIEGPVLLFIDEFDSLPPRVIDQLVTLFRDMYLKRESYMLHGLALLGVRAVLGIGSERGSPFNVQRSLHVPNLTMEEVVELFGQYEQESGQAVGSDVMKAVYDSTRGQPGLVSWFGELLTEKYNPGHEHTIDFACWADTYQAALQIEWNNTLLNMLKKARGPYLSEVLELFSDSEKPFRLDRDWCNYLYLNGIIDSIRQKDSFGRSDYVCRFSSPFVQYRLYDALTDDLVGQRLSLLALHPLDDLQDVFAAQGLNLPALLQRYKEYLQRLEDKGLSPWVGQPRRKDCHLTEAVGHFHLYAWIRQAVGRICRVSPEFPTGNGKVDLYVICREKRGIIEVKSFVDQITLENSVQQAAGYASSLGLFEVTLALFVPGRDQEILEKLSQTRKVNRVQVSVVAIGWG